MLFLYLIACQQNSNIEKDPSEEGEILTDNDGDGYLSNEDCDDSNPLINPETQEICDGMDNSGRYTTATLWAQCQDSDASLF